MSEPSFCLSPSTARRKTRRPRQSPEWWEPLLVLALCVALGWVSWYVAFGGWR